MFDGIRDATMKGRVLNLLGNDIYVRDCWESLYIAIRNIQAEDHISNIVVTGSPGIGKSLFALYFMWRWYNENPTSDGFVYETTPDELRYFSNDSVAVYTRNDCYKIPSGIPYFVDLKARVEPIIDEFGWVPQFTVVFSSPDSARFKEFLKTGRQLVMPPWQASEILEAHSLIPKYRQINREIVDSQFEIYGGVPRYVFGEKRTEGRRSMDEALGAKGIECSKKVFSFAHDEVEPALSHLILQMVPTDDTFRRYVLLPATCWVLQELVLKHDADLKNLFSQWMEFRGSS